MAQVRKDVLNGWKEIAAYLGRDPRTVERWEKQRALPVRRLPGAGRATVYALVPELDAWLAGPQRLPPSPAQEEGTAEPSAPSQPVRELSARSEPEHVERFPSAAGAAPAVSFAAEMRPKSSRQAFVISAVLTAAALGLLGISLRAVQRHRVGQGQAGLVGVTSRGRRLPQSPVAVVNELYLRGRYHAELRTPEALHQAEEDFTQAIQRDPRYAPAYAGLGATYVLLREYSMLSDAEAYSRARAAASRALELDPELPQAHAVMGFVQFFGLWDDQGAERNFQEALRLDPDLALGHHWYGSMLAHQGRFGESLRELNTAQSLDPSSSAILTIRAFALGLSGHKTEAEQLLDDAVPSAAAGQYPVSITMHRVLGVLSLLPPRDAPRFLGEELVAADLRHDKQTLHAVRKATVVLKARGEGAMWRSLLQDELQERGKDGPSYTVARYEAASGETDAALRDLNVLCERRDPALIGMRVDPLLKNLREDERFVRLLRTVGLDTSRAQ